MVVRGRGPSLAGIPGISDPLHDPILELYNSNPSSGPIAENDNWQDDQRAEISNSGLAPGSTKDSAIIQTLAPGAYTVIVRDKDTSAARLGIVEVFDVAPAASSQLGNLSSRGFVGTGENVLIGGVIVGPANTGRVTLLVRSLGPLSVHSELPGRCQIPNKVVNQTACRSPRTIIGRQPGCHPGPGPALAPSQDAESASWLL